MKPEFAPHFLDGVEHFNALRFWEAHESWEELWLAAQSDLEQFLQGLIQLAAAYHHVRRGTWRGGLRLFDAALRRLEAFPTVYCGIDRTDAVKAAQVHRERIARLLQAGASDPLPDSEYPKLSRVSTDLAPMPPFVQW
jgi:predicted metal-dependent hydrolase